MPEFIFPALQGSRVHLGVCGSVSAYKAIELMRLLQRQGIFISVTLTESACQFVTPLTFSSLGADPVYQQMFVQSEHPFAHLEPGNVAHVFAIVPASATTIARLSSGLADEILSAQALAFQGTLFICPAMNPKMWTNAATQENIQTLKNRGHRIMLPASGEVACGDTGVGKLPDVEAIAFNLQKEIIKARGLNDLEGKKILVTLGPTRERWDAIRYWSNPSTGYMGASVALAAWLRGAEVYAIAGPGVPKLPQGITVVSCESAYDMYEAVMTLLSTIQYGVFTAAVADFSPKPYGSSKFKKAGQDAGFFIDFLPNKDILATAGQHKKSGQIFVGFAAESDNLLENAQSKLMRKNADMIVANAITTFGSDSNTAVFITQNKLPETLDFMSKPQLAWKILDTMCVL